MLKTSYLNINIKQPKIKEIKNNNNKSKEMYATHTHTHREKINEDKNWLLEMTNKIKESLGREKAQTTTIRLK